MNDPSTRDAIAALTRRIRDRDIAVHDGGERSDPEPFAAELVTALRALGWRPTEAKPPPPWKQDRPGPDKDTYARGLARARQQLEAS